MDDGDRIHPPGQPDSEQQIRKYRTFYQGSIRYRRIYANLPCAWKRKTNSSNVYARD